MKYNEDAKLIWESFLNKTDVYFSQYKPFIEKNTNYYAVIIEPREHTDMLLSIRNTMYYLNENNSKIKWGLQIFHGTKNEKFVKSFSKNWKNVKGDKALIFQTDSLLLRSGIDEFLEYDYIGAPWRKPKEGQLVGNGGLSLRSVTKMVEICDKYSPNQQIWEDIFFIKHLKGQGVADYETAKRFSMEDVYSINPLGVHNPIRHIDPELLRSVLFK